MLSARRATMNTILISSHELKWSEKWSPKKLKGLRSTLLNNQTWMHARRTYRQMTYCEHVTNSTNQFATFQRKIFLVCDKCYNWIVSCPLPAVCFPTYQLARNRRRQRGQRFVSRWLAVPILWHWTRHHGVLCKRRVDTGSAELHRK